MLFIVTNVETLKFKTVLSTYAENYSLRSVTIVNVEADVVPEGIEKSSDSTNSCKSRSKPENWLIFNFGMEADMIQGTSLATQ